MARKPKCPECESVVIDDQQCWDCDGEEICHTCGGSGILDALECGECGFIGDEVDFNE